MWTTFVWAYVANNSPQLIKGCLGVEVQQILNLTWLWHIHRQLIPILPWLWKQMQLAPHTPTPSTGRDNTSASCGFEAAVPGPLSVPGFLCLNCRKEALSSMRPQGPGERRGVCLCVCIYQCCGSVQRFFAHWGHIHLLAGFFPLWLFCTWTLVMVRV